MNKAVTISVKDLELGYKPGKPIYKNFSIDAYEGELIALVGRNGMGKSTLLRTLAGLQPAHSGTIRLGGYELDDISKNKRARLLSFVPADPIKIPNLDVRSFVGIGRFPYTGWSTGLTSGDWDKIDYSLHLVGIEHIAHCDIAEISDGERQRAMIAFALAQDTNIILLDEPTAFLDLPNKFEMVRLLSSLTNVSQKTIVYSTHDLQGAINEADTIWMMLPDVFIAGSPEDIALSGGFARLLEDTNVVFNLETGVFSNKRLHGKEAYLVGEGVAIHWTKKMMHRLGYETVDDANARVKVLCFKDNDKPYWILKQEGKGDVKISNINELAHLLKCI